METPMWLRDHAEERFRDRLPVLAYSSGNELRQTGSPEDQQRDLLASFDQLAERHRSVEYRAVEADEIMLRKNFAATGAFLPEDRPRALDLLGFQSQLVFNTFHNGRLHDLEHAGDVDLAYAAVWARAEEADLPVVFHVGGTGALVDPSYFVNGLPIPHDFHGGDENFRSVDYMGIPGPPAQTLATLIFDGIFEAFPSLRVGVIEQGAIWVPSWTRQMESAFEAFSRHEERLQNLSMRPSEYVQRQIRFTPYPTEDVGWIVEQGGEDLVMFSSDYPHVEGGRKPLERFEASLGDASEAVRSKFYSENFAFLMGQRLKRNPD